MKSKNYNADSICRCVGLGQFVDVTWITHGVTAMRVVCKPSFHQESLAGNAAMVEELLKHGADRSLRTRAGDSAQDLAARMKWDGIVALLAA